MTDIEILARSRTYEGNIIKLNEEMGELAQAVSKCFEDETAKTRQAVVEELADVMICMELIRFLLRISDAQITDMKHHKMVRNMQRLRGHEGK